MSLLLCKKRVLCFPTGTEKYMYVHVNPTTENFGQLLRVVSNGVF